MKINKKWTVICTAIFAVYYEGMILLLSAFYGYQNVSWWHPIPLMLLTALGASMNKPLEKKLYS